MSDHMQYKGYAGSVEYSGQDGCLHGRILYIRSLVTYEADEIGELKKGFRQAVEDYLEDCRERNVEPEKPFKGSFNVRISPEAHRKATLKAAREGLSLNKLVERALNREIA